ncbi:GNAT family N-acetyltransferase [Actinomyces sp. MRS3W]|uniref:GNAT family N-acetyltransferase n=1 Tax=Actinomyces sp. MRS3W TaxID=2800796 RepID=UPI0028FD2F9B|nr:GNAT family N-acetyltransferase [Actinomyces sp. MRS3W]MDU0349421.1 GNAT family N-acetyltransferase [Actinomyces sp. MRS3W]
MSSTMIRPGTPQDLDAVADLLTDVFAADPLMRTIAAAAPDARAALDHLHRHELAGQYLSPDPTAQSGTRVDVVVDTGGRIIAAALWHAPASPPAAGADASEPAGPIFAGLDVDVLGGAWELIRLDGAQCEAAQPHDPHWYLYMLAVASQARGSGTGTALLRHGLERVDADGVAAHLESTSPASRRLYEREGFTLTATLDAPPLPIYWAMTRPAQPTGLNAS